VDDAWRPALERERHSVVCLMPRGGDVSRRIAFNVAGIVMVLMGTIWFLQGINVLPGSFMTGQTRWAVYGGLAVLLGLVVLVRANRRVVTRR
jgi:hypothetical protein